MGTRVAKVWVIVTGLLLTIAMLVPSVFGIRATTDEGLVFGDLIQIHATGYINQASYFSGLGYQIITGIIFNITGTSPSYLQNLSPAIGVIAFIVIALSLSRFAKPYIDKRNWWWATITIPAGLFAFAGFTNRLQESTHKAYTFTLLFISIWLAYRVVAGSTSLRIRMLTVTFAATIGLMNYVWGVIYGTLIMLIVFAAGHGRDRPAPLLPPFVSMVIVLWLPGLRIHQQYFLVTTRSVIRGLTGSGGASATASAGASSVGGWPTVTIFNISFSIWLVYVSGILFVCLLTASGGVHVLLRIARNRTVPPFSRVYLITGIVLSGLLGAFAVSGDLATFKRLLPVAGGLTIIYWLRQLGESDTIQSQRLALGIVIILVLTAPLALPRVTLDQSTGAPYDFYADESQVTHIIWQEKFGSPDCEIVTGYVEPYLAGKLVGTAFDRGYPPLDSDRIYSAGDDSITWCRIPS